MVEFVPEVQNAGPIVNGSVDSGEAATLHKFVSRLSATEDVVIGSLLVVIGERHELLFLCYYWFK
jgi:hypothetical protein